MGLIFGNEVRLVPLAAPGFLQRETGEHAGHEWDAQIDEDALRNLGHGNVDLDRPEAQPSWNGRQEEVRSRRRRTRPGRSSSTQPDRRRTHGRRCARSFHTMTMAMQRASPIRMRPVMYSGLSRSSSTASANIRMGPTTQFWTSERTRMRRCWKTRPSLFVLHLRQRRIHHQDQADGDGNGSRAHAEAVEKGTTPGTRYPSPTPAAMAAKIHSVR